MRLESTENNNTAFCFILSTQEQADLAAQRQAAAMTDDDRTTQPDTDTTELDPTTPEAIAAAQAAAEAFRPFEPRSPFAAMRAAAVMAVSAAQARTTLA